MGGMAAVKFFMKNFMGKGGELTRDNVQWQPIISDI